MSHTSGQSHTRAAAQEGVLEGVLRGFQRDRNNLIPLLQKTQTTLGYISEEAMAALSHYLRISENEVFGVASFYSQFRFVAPGRNSIKVCLGTACHVRGGQILSDTVERELLIHPGEATPDGRFDLERVACLGCCALAPVVQIRDDIHSRMTVTRLKTTLERYE
jgi:NADH-quinone oxidoreductase subunit E